MTERIRPPIQTSYSRFKVIAHVRWMLELYAEGVKEGKPGALKQAKDIFEYVEKAVLEGSVLSKIDKICNEKNWILDEKQLAEAARYYIDELEHTWKPPITRAIKHSMRG